MGYTTDFTGKFQIDKKLLPLHRNYLAKFSEVRHMKRDPKRITVSPTDLHLTVGLPLGKDGEFYVNGDSLNNSGPIEKSILDHNDPASTQPGLWCQWTPDEDGEVIEWDGGEKFYEYVNWLKYLIENFLHPWGYRLTGEVLWQGEESGDHGKIEVKNNKITVYTSEPRYCVDWVWEPPKAKKAEKVPKRKAAKRKS